MLHVGGGGNDANFMFWIFARIALVVAWRVLWRVTLVVFGIVALNYAACAVLLAHEAPTGWNYPFACCSNYDCREVGKGKAVQVDETPQGYVISTTKEVIPYSGDTRLRVSPDGEFHWCSVAGADDSRTICLFAPPSAF